MTMSRWMVVVLIAALPLTKAAAADGDEAMFGLRWGMSPKDVSSLGVTLAKKSADRNLETYTTTSLPRNLSDTEQYNLIFADGKLVKLVSISKDITGDPSGARGKEKFDAIAKALEEKYGAATDKAQVIGRKLYQEHDEFYQCLRYDGCGFWALIYKTPDKTIGVQLKGLRRGTGFLVVTTEAEPQFSSAMESYRSRQSSSDKAAL